MLAVLGVVVLMAVVFGVRVWLAGDDGTSSLASGPGAGGPSGVSRGTSTLSRASPSGAAPGSTSGPPGSSPTATGVPSSTPTAGAAGAVVVHVVGQVATPGVYRMAAGARVGDAVSAAGGATRAADLTAVNLARVLVDGEQIHVPKPGEVVAAPGGGPGAGSPGAGSGGAGGAGGGSGGGTGAGSAGGTVSLNSANLSEFDTLPGVGPVLAQRILDWRTEHGRFTSVEELGEVSGIGEKLLAQLTPKVTL